MGTQSVVLASVEPAAHIPHQDSTNIPSRPFDEILGQGDYDPAASDRLETGLIAVAALKQQHVKPQEGSRQAAKIQPASFNPTSAYRNNANWGVQIGAFNSRQASNQALQAAYNKLPGAYKSQATGHIAPLRNGQQWLFRARLRGFEESQAQQICKHFQECLVVPPL